MLNGQKVWTPLAQGRLGHLPGPDRPRRAQAPRHHLLPRRHARRGSRSGRCASSPAPPCSTRSSSTTCFVPDDARGRGARRRLAHRPDDAGQRARLDVLGRGVRQWGGVAAPDRGPPWRAPGSPPTLGGRLGHLIAEAQSLAQLGIRATLRSLSGVEPGSGVERAQAARCRHEQRVQELGLDICGPEGAVIEGGRNGGRTASSPVA